MSDLAPFSDPAAAVADVLANLVTVTYAGPRTLAAIQAGQLPAVRVIRNGGSDDLVTDTALVSVAVFAGDATAALSVAEACRQRLISGPFGAGSGFATAGGCVDHAATLSSPQLATDPSAAVTQCVTASYRVTMRRPSAQGG